MALTPLSAATAEATTALPDEPDMAARKQALRQDLARQAQTWRKRSRQIKRLRLLFPGLIIAIIVLIFGWIVIKSIIGALNVYNPATQDIRMTNPRFYGQTPSGDRYEVSGLEAVRKGNNTPVISLKAPIMEIRGDSGRPNHLEAATGIYNDASRMFDVAGRVSFSGGAAGMTLRTEQARVDISRNQVTGDGFVEGTWSQGRIQGESFAIYDNGARIIFHGKGEKQAQGVFYNK